MKIKAIMIASLMLFSCLMTGCAGDNNNNGGSNSGSGSMSGSDSNPGDGSMAGEYDNDDGFFNDDDSKDGNNSSDSSANGSESGDNSGDDSASGTGDNSANGGSAGGASGNSDGSQNGDMSTVDSTAARISLGAENLRSTLIGWGLGKECDELSRPVDAVSAQEKYGKYSSLFIDESGEKKIYLTFDEGYENGYTAKILDTLKETGVKAAFFVTYDYCVSSPELVERMIAEGHIVGNHTYSHPSLPQCSDSEVEEEVTLLHDYVKENFGYEMKFFRFPKGEFSEKTLAQLQSLGYTSVFWSFAYQDWDVNSQPTPDEAFKAVTNATHSGGIYLLHAVSQANADSLGEIIKYWKSEGYSVESLEALL